jgi:hypothetical protein
MNPVLQTNFEVTGVVCLAQCSDKKWRAVRLDPKQARKIFVYVDGMCDHRLSLLMHPVKVVLDKKRVSFWQRLRARFVFRKSPQLKEVAPTA